MHTLHAQVPLMTIVVAVMIVSPVAAEDVRLIAHRGGIVSPKYAENSPAGLEAAIRRGYWMLEVDVRETKDGRLVVNGAVFYGDWNDVQTVVPSTIPGFAATINGGSAHVA